MNNRITIRQIAKELGISAMTVSRALNNKSYVDPDTRRRVLEMAQKMGYKPNHIARSLTIKKTYTIGVVLPKLSHSFFPDAIRGIEEAAYQREYQLILAHSSEDEVREKKVIESLVSKRVDGILISSAENITDLQLYKELLEANYPIVFFDRWIPNLEVSSVKTNDEESMMIITEHLITKHGYTNIAHISGPQNVSIGLERYRGYKKAMENHDLTINEEWVVSAGFNEASGYEAMKKILNLPERKQIQAVVAVNDPTAFGAMEAIYEKGMKIPEDIAIVGFGDDKQDKLLASPLTTIHQPAYEEGKRAAQILIDLMEGKSNVTEDIVIKSYLVVRNSCGCNPMQK